MKSEDSLPLLHPELAMESAAASQGAVMPAAYTHNGKAIAAERFYALACEPQRSVVVEACAGAGKTWLLVSRMLRALLEGSEAHEILAITFTKKAAGEMRLRLQQWLTEFAHASDDALRDALRARGLEAASAQQLAALRGLHARLLRMGRPVQIRTFHSWFAALLRAAPLRVVHALGLPANYQLLEDDEQAVAQVWQRFQRSVLQTTQELADYRELVATHGRHQAHKALDAALQKRTEFALADAHGVVLASVPTFGQQFADFAGLQEPMDALWTTGARAALHAAARALGATVNKTCLAGATRLERALSQQDGPGVLGALLTQDGAARSFSEKLPDLDAVRAAQDFLLRVGDAQRQHDAWRHQQGMTRLTRLMLRDYAEVKRANGWIDMGDLERAAMVLLADPMLSGWVQERLDARLRHLMIDEFQDTNPLQWQALSAWLSAYAGAANAPSVFIVGDPKQSIYRFRRAEPEVFRAAKSFVQQALQGDLLSCDHTRRNAAVVLGAVNGVFQQAQQDGAFDGFRPHTTDSQASGLLLRLPIIARADPQPQAAAQAGAVAPAPGEVVQPGAGTHPDWRDSLRSPRDDAEEGRKLLECRQAARWLASALQAPGSRLRARDVLVLARKRAHLRLMQQELASLHIAAQQPEKMDLSEVPEIQDMVALLDVLVSPDHDLAMARVLKSPLFGASDQDLVQLALGQRAASAASSTAAPSWSALLHDPEVAPAPLRDVAAKLLRWSDLLARLPVHDALTIIYREGDVLARYAARAEPASRARSVAQLNALLHAALALDGGRYSTPYALVRALRAPGVAGSVRADANAVQLLTIHGAKGLEAPLVLLLDTEPQAQNAETMGVLLNWPGQAPAPQQFVFLASAARPAASQVDAVARERAEREREELNALYVAMTRARRVLLLSASQPQRSAAASWWQRLLPWIGQEASPDAPRSAQGGTRAEPAEPVPANAQDSQPAFGGGDAGRVAGAGEDARADQAPGAREVFSLRVLPELAAHRRLTQEPLPGASAEAPESLEARVGQAMHRLLEYLPLRAGAYAAPDNVPQWSAPRLRALAQAFALDAAQLARAQTMARTIACGAASWAWDSRCVAWWGNEVTLQVQGRTLRLDRLLRRQDSGEWWVLDYKSAARPQDQPALRAQLAEYRQALIQLQPQQRVRAAFLSASGACVECEDP